METMQTLDPSLESLAQEVIGAAIEVHRTLGPGYLESVYEKALSAELCLRNIPHICQAPIVVSYKGESVGEGRIDMLVADQLVLELKCADGDPEIFKAQTISYLKATGLLAYVMNFKKVTLKQGLQRIVRS